MLFDIKAMSVRSKEIIKESRENQLIVGALFVAVSFLIMSLMATAFTKVEANTGNPWGIYLVLVICLIIAEYFCIGFSWYYLKLVREQESCYKDVFSQFFENQGKAFLCSVLKTIIILLFSSLFFIPGIIAFYWLRPLHFLIKDGGDKSVFTLLGDSINLMKGHKMELFKIDVSLIVWHILNWVSCGMANIYVKSYVGIIYAEYYEYLMGIKEVME